MTPEKLLELEELLSRVAVSVAELRRNIVARTIATGNDVKVETVSTQEYVIGVRAFLIRALRLVEAEHIKVKD